MRIFIYSILLSFLLTPNGDVFAQLKELQFDHITNENGLGSSTVHCICQDSYGFMWFGTSAGLYRYDGYQLKAYTNNRKDTSSIVDNRINAICAASDNTLYIGTWDRGLCIFDRNTESFIEYSKSSTTHPLASNKVKCIFEDSHKNIWVGLENGGLNLFDKKTKQFIHFRMPADEDRCMAIAENKKGEVLICGYTTGLYIFDAKTKIIKPVVVSNSPQVNMTSWSKRMKFDDKGNLWVVTSQSGLFCYDFNNKTLKHWDANNKDLGCSSLSDIVQESSNTFWLATDGGGLVKMDAEKEMFTHYKNESNKLSSLNTNALYCLYKDNTNILWIGTYNGGVNIFNPNKLKFPCYRPVYQDNTSLSHKAVLTIFEDKDNNLWIGTDGGGLNLYNPQKNGQKFIRYLPDPQHPNESAPAVVKSIFQDSFGRLWLGTWNSGLVLFDPKTHKFTYNLLKGSSVWSIQEDKNKQLWISSLGHGVYKIDLETLKFKEYSPYTNCGLNTLNILCIFKDSKERLWFGSEGDGLFLFQPEKDRFKNYQNIKGNLNSLSGNIVRTIFESKNGQVWVGTLCHGLNLFNEKTESFSVLEEENGMIGNTINSILEDKSHNLWISSNNGITKYNFQTKKIKQYDKLDGLQSNDFNYGAAMLMADGEMAFGGVNGLNIFDPDQIVDNPNRPPVFITGLSIFNQPVKMNDETSILTKSIIETKSIILSYKQSVLTFSFSALNFTHSQKNKYAYILERFEKKWNEVENRKEATYTNLDPGKYTFRVKACNNDGIWNETGTSMLITILPPFWKTWWFKLLSFLVISGVTIAIFAIRINALKKQKVMLEKKVKERTLKLNESNILLKERQIEITQQAEELVQQRDELKTTNEKISQQHESIKASVRYAQTLQQAILPSLHPVEELFECFTIYKPKDIVSGDFYWYAQLNSNETAGNQIKKRFILSVIDCTGHGVPGAFMTLVADRHLYEAVVEHKIESPSEILEQLDRGVQATLKQNVSSNRDGMDLVVCLFEVGQNESVTLTFSGSKNPLFYYRKSDNQVVRVEADRRYIGMMSTKAEVVNFTNNRFELAKGDIVFLCTDGYIDQSNDDRKRLGTHNFTTYLQEFADLPMHQFKTEMENRLKAWQGNQMQRDDICIIGVRI